MGLTLGGWSRCRRASRPERSLVLTGIGGAAHRSAEPAARRVIEWLRSARRRVAAAVRVRRQRARGARGTSGRARAAPRITHTWRSCAASSRAPGCSTTASSSRTGRYSPAPGSPPDSISRCTSSAPARAASGRRRGPRPGGVPAPRRHRSGAVALGDAPQSSASRRCTACRTRWRATRRRAGVSRELSEVACTSARNLARLFAEHAHCSPLDYVQLIRFALARQLVTQSRLDLERVRRGRVSLGATPAARVVALGGAAELRCGDATVSVACNSVDRDLAAAVWSRARRGTCPRC